MAGTVIQGTGATQIWYLVKIVICTQNHDIFFSNMFSWDQNMLECFKLGDYYRIRVLRHFVGNVSGKLMCNFM